MSRPCFVVEFFCENRAYRCSTRARCFRLRWFIVWLGGQGRGCYPLSGDDDDERDPDPDPDREGT